MTTHPGDHASALARVNADMQRIQQHQIAGRFEQAGQMIETLRAQYPDQPRIQHLYGMNLIQMGQIKEGRAQLVDVLSRSKDDVQVKVDYGTVLAQNGELDKAIEMFREAVETAPNFGIAHANLGAALVVEKDYAPAITHLKKAIDLDGSILDLHLNLAQAYMRTHRFDPAIESLYKALAVDPQSASAHSNLAAALFRRERHEAAEHHARRSIELAPEAEEPWFHLGNILGASGKMDEAAEAYLKIASHPPVGVQATARLISLRKTKPDSPELKILVAYLARLRKMPKEQQNTVHFAMAKASDDLGDHAKAIAHFHKGNEINKELHPFDADSFLQRAERLRSLVTPALISRCSSTSISDLAPIFVCGMPRSGTTLMDQMFSRHPNVMAGGELSAATQALGQNAQIRKALEHEIPVAELASDDFARLGEDYEAHVRREGLRGTYISDKMPANYLYVGLLAMALPRAKFLIMRRHPLDCLLSNYMQNFGQNQPFSSDFTQMAAVYDQFDQMAHQWSNLLPDRVRQVAYEDIVADTEGRMRDILRFVGLEWNDSILDHTASTRQVNTASVAQVRQPVYTSAVARWRRYGPLIRDLAIAVQDHLSRDDLRACGIGPDS